MRDDTESDCHTINKIPFTNIFSAWYPYSGKYFIRSFTINDSVSFRRCIGS